MSDKTGYLPGTASIKSEYLDIERVRELNLEFVANKDKRSFNDSDANKDTLGEPQKKKLKGQNRHRPREKRLPKSKKLCFSIGANGVCNYGDNCPFSHDITSYLASKPNDIGDNCHLFEIFGNCPYSFSCRFAAQHTVGQKNVVNEELWKQFKDDKRVLNVLPKNLQADLRKYKFDFSRAYDVCKAVVKRSKKIESHRDTATTSKDVKDNSSLQQHATVEVSGDCENGETLQSKADTLSDTMKVENYQPLDDILVKLRPAERKKVDFRGKLYLAPLTTVGNLPFRRICKTFGADITCGEMAMATSLLQAQQSEWALLKRHKSEDIFGVQVCGSSTESMTKCAQLLSESVEIDFIDINMGCPLDPIYTKGAGCGLMGRLNRMDEIVLGMSTVANVPLTVKMRAGVYANQNTAHNVIKRICQWGDCVSLITVHGRSRVQRYTKSANWSYINECALAAHPIPLFGSGDVMSFEDYDLRCQETGVAGAMLARGALIKPWIFTEIKEKRHWDISSTERLDILKTYVNYGLEHWGSDTEGVEKVRRFLLEWLSFLYRYIPVGLLEHLPQHINERPPPYHGRNELETLMASPSCASWVKISEMLLGPVPENFVFLPKHKANAYQ